jgi:predicted nucleic-acid-binding Zn-ribbon protein
MKTKTIGIVSGVALATSGMILGLSNSASAVQFWSYSGGGSLGGIVSNMFTTSDTLRLLPIKADIRGTAEGESEPLITDENLLITQNLQGTRRLDDNAVRDGAKNGAIVVFVMLFGAALLLRYVRLALFVLALVFALVVTLLQWLTVGLQWLTGGKLNHRAKRFKSSRELLDEKKKREQTTYQLKKFFRNPFRYLGTKPPKLVIETKHPPLPSTPKPSVTRQCPRCGSSSLGERKVTLTATRAIDHTRRIEREFDATQLYCKQCDFVLNDDLRGDIARAYSGLGDVQSSFDIDRKVAEVMQGARNLPEISDADVDNDFGDVREVWECLKVVTIPERDLQSTVSRLIRGYAQEGASDLGVSRLDQNILQISFIFDNSRFQGVRIARKAGGSFAAYGLARMYRLVGAGV